MERRLLFGFLLLLPSLLSAKKDGDYIDGFSCGGKPLKDMFPDLNKNGTLGDQICNNNSFWVHVNTPPTDGQRMQLWVGTKTSIPTLNVSETPGFHDMDRGDVILVDKSQGGDGSMMVADYSSLKLPASLPCGGSYLVALIVDIVDNEFNGEIVDFESQSIYVNCDGDSAGVDFGLEIDGFDFNDTPTLTKGELRSTLMNTVLKPGENPFKALGISGVRLTSKTRFQERAAITKPDVFMALYADDNLAGNWSNFIYNTEALIELINTTSRMDAGMMSSRMVMSAPLHKESLFFGNATENGTFPEIGAGGRIPLDLEKARMPLESYHETWNCSNAFIVIGVDPFSFYESNLDTRLDNFIIIPVQRECMDVEPACLVSPSFSSAGQDALICDGMGMTEGYCFKYQGQRNSFQHKSLHWDGFSLMTRIAEMYADRDSNDVDAHCESLTRVAEKRSQNRANKESMMKAISSALESVSTSLEKVNFDEEKMSEIIKAVSDTMKTIEGDEALTKMFYQSIMRMMSMWGEGGRGKDRRPGKPDWDDWDWEDDNDDEDEYDDYDDDSDYYYYQEDDTSGDYFLANGSSSCDDSCAMVGMSCDLEKVEGCGCLVTAAAESVAICKDIIESLGKSTQKGGTYKDDRSGCTYHPGQQGWHQVMSKGGQPPTCSEVNRDRSRRRVCACKSSHNGTNATSRMKRQASRQQKGKPDRGYGGEQGQDRYGEDYDMKDKMNPSAWLSKVVGTMLEKKRSMIMREEWRDNLLVQLGSCIYGDIWEGQVEEEDSGPLCNSMSKELRTRWKNIANNILQEESFAMPSNMLMKMRVGKQLGEVFEKMEDKLEALPFSRTQLSVFMSNAREILRNASFASNASNDQSFYTNMAAIIKSVNDSDQAMERITNITKRIQGYMKQVERGGCSLERARIDEAPEPMELCRLRIGAGIAQYQQYLVNRAEEAKTAESSQGEKKRMEVSTDPDIFKSVFWRRDGQKISKLRYNNLIDQWVSQKVAKCSCENDMHKCPASWGKGKDGWGKDWDRDDWDRDDWDQDDWDDGGPQFDNRGKGRGGGKGNLRGLDGRNQDGSQDLGRGGEGRRQGDDGGFDRGGEDRFGSSNERRGNGRTRGNKRGGGGNERPSGGRGREPGWDERGEGEDGDFGSIIGNGNRRGGVDNERSWDRNGADRDGSDGGRGERNGGGRDGGGGGRGDRNGAGREGGNGGRGDRNGAGRDGGGGGRGDRNGAGRDGGGGGRGDRNGAGRDGGGGGRGDRNGAGRDGGGGGRGDRNGAGRDGGGGGRGDRNGAGRGGGGGGRGERNGAGRDGVGGGRGDRNSAGRDGGGGGRGDRNSAGRDGNGNGGETENRRPRNGDGRNRE